MTVLVQAIAIFCFLPGWFLILWHLWRWFGGFRAKATVAVARTTLAASVVAGLLYTLLLPPRPIAPSIWSGIIALNVIFILPVSAVFLAAISAPYRELWAAYRTVPFRLPETSASRRVKTCRKHLRCLFLILALSLTAAALAHIAVLGGYGRPFESETYKSASMSNMYHIGLALQGHRFDHDDELAWNLQQLCEQGYLDPTRLENPRWPNRYPGYIYVRPVGPGSDIPPGLVVLYENYGEWPDIGVCCMRMDGGFHLAETPAELRGLLEPAYEYSAQKVAASGGDED